MFILPRSIFRGVLLGKSFRRFYTSVVPAATAPIVTRTSRDTVVSIKLGEKTHLFHTVWLRDHCRCDKCYHRLTNQRLVDTLAIPSNIKARDAVFDPDTNEIVISWTDGPACTPSSPHVSRFPVHWLERCAYWTEPSAAAMTTDKTRRLEDPVWDKRHRVVWTASNFGSRHMSDEERAFPAVPYDTFMSRDDVLLQALIFLRDYGFFRVENVPVTMEATEAVNARVAFARETFYGRGIWRTEMRPITGAGDGQPYNDTAYTCIPLPAHTDCTYMLDPPGIQTFHALAANPEGGETILVDGFAIARHLQQTAPATLKFFSAFEILFQHTDPDVHMSCWGRVFEYDDDGAITSMRFNNDDRAPVQLRQYGHLERIKRGYEAALQEYDNVSSPSSSSSSSGPSVASSESTSGSSGNSVSGGGIGAGGSDMPPSSTALADPHIIPRYYSHLRTLLTSIRNPSHEVVMKLQPGTILMFDNRRVLHGRQGFNPSYPRVLAGAYMNTEDWHSRLRQLSYVYGLVPAPPQSHESLSTTTTNTTANSTAATSTIDDTSSTATSTTSTTSATATAPSTSARTALELNTTQLRLPTPLHLRRYIVPSVIDTAASAMAGAVAVAAASASDSSFEPSATGKVLHGHSHLTATASS